MKALRKNKSMNRIGKSRTSIGKVEDFERKITK
jgi:hypothetical protein